MYSPQTNIRLLSTPLENDGANTLTWNSITEQTNYFLSKTVFSFADTTYQRKGSYMRIDRNIEELYRCNYVMYKNSAYTDKWFYAFITDFEYVNDGVTYVYIEPDEIQTWYFDIQFKESFVVREHTNDDSIGANQTDEGLGLGGYVCNKKEKMYTDLMSVCILKPLNISDSDISVTNKIGNWFWVDGVTLANKEGRKSKHYTLSWTDSGLFLNNINITDNASAYGIGYEPTTAFGSTGSFDLVVNIANVQYLNHNWLAYLYDSAPMDSTTAIQNWFNDLAERSLLDDIGAFYLAPNIAVSTGDVGNVVTKLEKNFTPVRNLDGYVPKNNKMFCYPYTIIKLHNGSDSNRILQPELFNNFNSMDFEYWTDKMPSSSVVATPKNYAGVRHSLEYSINSAKYPLSSASFDSFKNYLGIHRAEYNIQVASRLRGGIAMVGVGATGSTSTSIRDVVQKHGRHTVTMTSGKQRIYSGYTDKLHSEQSTVLSGGTRALNVVKGATQIASTLAEVNARQNEAYQTIGTVSNNNLNASGDLNIYIEQQSINSDYAKRIDDYFSMYGYKTNLLKVPNITGRRNWNYVQTINANITADIPNDSLDTIRELLDGGVTFWHNPNTMYDYSQDNAII